MAASVKVIGTIVYRTIESEFAITDYRRVEVGNYYGAALFASLTSGKDV